MLPTCISPVVVVVAIVVYFLLLLLLHLLHLAGRPHMKCLLINHRALGGMETSCCKTWRKQTPQKVIFPGSPVAPLARISWPSNLTVIPIYSPKTVSDSMSWSLLIHGSFIKDGPLGLVFFRKMDRRNIWFPAFPTRVKESRQIATNHWHEAAILSRGVMNTKASVRHPPNKFSLQGCPCPRPQTLNLR